MRALRKTSGCSQDQFVDDDMEERLSRTAGVDAETGKTFGKDLCGWSYEKALKANDKLVATPLKPSVVKDYASTAPGSRVHSEGPSSESSTPRASMALPASAMLSADAAPF